MPLTRFKRAVAALLPVSILWVFAACVLICGWEHAAAHGEPHFAPAAEVNEAADARASEGCPDAAFLKAVTARVTLQPESQALGRLPASIITAVSSADAVTRVSPYRQRFQTATPLSLSPALRI